MVNSKLKNGSNRPFAVKRTTLHGRKIIFNLVSRYLFKFFEGIGNSLNHSVSFIHSLTNENVPANSLSGPPVFKHLFERLLVARKEEPQREYVNNECQPDKPYWRNQPSRSSTNKIHIRHQKPIWQHCNHDASRNRYTWCCERGRSRSENTNLWSLSY